MIDWEATIEKIRSKLGLYLGTHSLSSLVCGISGGIDSAVTVALASPVCRECDIPLMGRSITIDSNKPDEIARAKKVGELYCTDFQEIDATELYRLTLKQYEEWAGGELDAIARGNLKARERMKILYMLAGRNRGLVLSTDNLTEYYLGFWTLHGDVGDLGMIQNLSKPEVYLLAASLCAESGDAGLVLSECIGGLPTDGLGITNSDLDQIMPGWEKKHAKHISAYAEVHERIEAWLEKEPTMPDMTVSHDPIISRYRATKYKRNNPVNFKRHEIVVEKEG